MAQSQRWKVLEKKAAKELSDATGLEWIRKTRGANFAISDTDVEPPQELSYFKIDCKKYARLNHHALMQEIQDKYCNEPGDQPVLITEENMSASNPRTVAGHKLETYATIRLELFVKLTNAFLKQQKED